MRNRLALILVLAAIGLVAVAAVAGAQGDLLETGQGNVSIDLPDGEDLGGAAGGALPACSNTQDDDGDGTADTADPGCSGPLDTDEYNAPTGGGGGSTSTTTPGTTTTTPDVDPQPDTESPDLDRPDIGNGGGGGHGGGNDTGGVKPGKGKGDGTSKPGGRDKQEAPPLRNPDGSPSKSNPTLSVADFAPAPIGISNEIIDQFSIPPFLLPIYQACGTQYGIPWQVLASINRIETHFGQLAGVTSTAGAIGWMQFLPSTWEAYGVDANGDGRKDPYNPVDAICGAARYLRAAGGESDLRRAIFAYNHADWYVDEVLLYAEQYGKLPDDLIGSITGLTEGAHFPVAAKARYADDISEREAARRAKEGDASGLYESSPTRRGINIYAEEGAPVVAVNDGVIKKIGRSDQLGNYLVLQDAYGNRYTYAELGEISEVHPVPKERDLKAADFELISPDKDPAPAGPATDADPASKLKTDGSDGGGRPAGDREPAERAQPALANTEDSRERLYALPERPRNVDQASLSGQLDELLDKKMPAYESFKSYFSGVLKFDRDSMDLAQLREGSQVVAGTVLGEIGPSDAVASHVNFQIRPTGRGAPKIDPKPILDGWKLLEATAIYRAAGKDPFGFSDASIGQILLLSKAQLQRRVLSDPRLEIYACGREDIETGQIDRRILALMSYLAESGFRLTVTSLKCGHSVYTTSGGVSHHSSGNAVDIAQVNGIPILGNQGRGSITEATIQQVLKLQGNMEPAQVISLMEMGGPTFAMGDHADHIHVGYQPLYDAQEQDKQFVRMLKPEQWERLIGRIAEIDNPEIPTGPAKYSLPADGDEKGKRRSGRSSDAHIGE
ncbi:MAG TPA: lytic murein transglycosylase [Solirubrobacterales bacterium]